MIKTSFINHSERFSVTKKSQTSNHRGQENCEESAMSATVIYHTYKNQITKQEVAK